MAWPYPTIRCFDPSLQSSLLLLEELWLQSPGLEKRGQMIEYISPIALELFPGVDFPSLIQDIDHSLLLRTPEPPKLRAAFI